MHLRSIKGICYYHRDLNSTNWRGFQAVYVRKVGDMGISMKVLYATRKYLLFFKLDKEQRWDVIGDRVFMPCGGSGWKVPADWWLFMVGKYAQNKIPRWAPSGSTPMKLDQRHHSFHYHSYGIVLLEGFKVLKLTGIRKIRIVLKLLKTCLIHL